MGLRRGVFIWPMGNELLNVEVTLAGLDSYTAKVEVRCNFAAQSNGTIWVTPGHQNSLGRWTSVPNFNFMIPFHLRDSVQWPSRLLGSRISRHRPSHVPGRLPMSRRYIGALASHHDFDV